MSPVRAGPDVEAALRHIKPRVRQLAPYTLRHLEAPIKLNQNESPYDLPAELKAQLWESLRDRPWNRYPPFVASDFIHAVADATAWTSEGVLVGNGSNELIQALLAIVVGPGATVVIPEPTFTLYRLLTGVGGGAVAAVPLDSDLCFDVDGIVAAARTSQAAMIVLCTPNNPTGGALRREEIERIYDETEALVVLDQAYVEFGGYDALPLLEERPRLVLLRTFSKAMALAGLRAGYLLAHPALVGEVAKAKLPYNLNFATASIAAEVLRNRALLTPRVQEISRERARLEARLGELSGIRVYPSRANFVLFRVEREDLDQASVFQRLLDECGVLVRDVSGYPMLRNCLRVTAGSPAENDAFLNGMQAILGNGPGSPSLNTDSGSRIADNG